MNKFVYYLKGVIEMRFEEITLEHLESVVNFYIKSFNSEPWNDRWTEESATKRLTQMINCEGSYGLVCYLDEEPVGMILGNHEYYYDAMHFNIKEFCVDHSKKGQGIGKKVLNEFTNRLKDKGINYIYLLTSRTDKTEGFYKKNEYESVDDVVMMERNI
ncbi:GNAT family N-acetyltransferase [Clostridium sardiniense]